MNALVSIVLPVHNGERFVAEALRSCLEQDYAPIEVIVVDDASTDRTPQIVERLASGREDVRVVRHETNRRLPAALNTGFALARGDLLTWTSDDNLFHPDAVRRMAEALAADPDLDAVYADFALIDEHGVEAGRREVGPIESLPKSNPVGACFLYRRRMAQAVGPYAEDLFGLEDYDFWVRAACRHRLRPLHETLYRYRVHGGSLSARMKDEREPLAETCLRRNLPKMPAWMRAGAHEHLARIARRRGMRWTYLARLSRLAVRHPVRALAVAVRERRDRGAASTGRG